MAVLSVAVLGVVYGDIGTSPIYALRECFAGKNPIPITPDNVLGILGASMLYGGAMITPAISVLSAVEGLELAAPGLHTYLIPITLGILEVPEVLLALNPVYAVKFFMTNGFTGYFVLYAVFLVTTGAEALYADLGHFGRYPIRIVWFAFVLPALLLNYFGQGAIMIAEPSLSLHPFFHLAPSWHSMWPVSVVATACRWH